MSQNAIAGAAGTPPKRRRRRRRPGIGRFVFLGAFLIFVLGPLYWMFITSIKPSDDYLAVPPVWFPSHPTVVHYIAALFAYRGLLGHREQPHNLDLGDRAIGVCRNVDGL